MSNVQVRRELRELQQFILNRKTENIRNELYEYMIMRVIFDHAPLDGYLAYDAIFYHLEKDYHLSKIPSLHVDSAISRLISGSLIEKSDNKFKISKKKKEEISTNVKEYDELRDNVIKNLRITITQKIRGISSQQVELIVSNFQELLGSTFAKYGLQAAGVFVDGGKKVTTLKGYIGFQELYQKLIVQTVPAKLSTELDKMFNEFFFKPSEELSRFYFTMAQSYVLLEILNVDPDLKRLQEIAWSKKQIYLDTNVLIALLFEGSGLSEPMITLLKNTQALGATILISRRTAMEYEKWLDDCRHMHGKIQPTGRVITAFSSVEHDDPFIKTYTQSLQRIPSLEVNDFLKNYESYDKILPTKYGIKIENSDDDSIESLPQAEKLKSKIMEYSPRKTSRVAAHDMYNILRIRQLREKSPSTEVGPNFWFLTNDHSLTKAEKDVFGEINIPANVTTEIWLQVISPFISPQIAIKDTSIAFSKLMSSNFTSHKIDLKDFDDLIKVFMDEADLTNAQLRAIIGDSYVREKLREFKETLDRGEELKLERIKPFISKVQKIIKDDYEKQIQESNQQHELKIKKVEKTVESLSSQVESLTKEKEQAEQKNKLLKIIIGLVIGFAVLDIVLYYTLDAIKQPIYVIIGAELSLIGGVQSTIIFKLPNLLKHFAHKKEEDE